MEIFVILVIVGGIMLIIMINNDLRRQTVYRELIEQHKRTIFLINRDRWLCDMGYIETANSFNLIG